MIKFEGYSAYVKELNRLSSLDASDITLRNLKQMANRASKPPGTPVDTGELKGSRRIASGDTFGYTKHYAAHVEFGHRTASGGYVAGQGYLNQNFNTQKKILREDIEKALRGR